MDEGQPEIESAGFLENGDGRMQMIGKSVYDMSMGICGQKSEDFQRLAALGAFAGGIG